ncbi:MAG: hypothetical protein KA143_05800 [Saprospiraceae bacterium]|nr:hypothetical protein [Saprospiraceae bacterium]
MLIQATRDLPGSKKILFPVSGRYIFVHVLNKKLVIGLLLLTQLVAGLHKSIILLDYCLYHLHSEEKSTHSHECKIDQINIGDSFPTYLSNFSPISDFEITNLPSVWFNTHHLNHSEFEYKTPHSSKAPPGTWRPPLFS